MKVSNHSNMRKYIVVTVLALVAALSLEIMVFMQDTEIEISGEAVSLFDQSVCDSTATGYEVSDNQYSQVTADPQFIFLNVDRTVSHILLSFAKPVNSSVNVQVFFRKENADFSSNNASQIHEVPFGTMDFVVEIPQNNYDALRIDIDGSFAVADIQVSNDVIALRRFFANPFNILQFLIMIAFFGAVGCAAVHWLCAEKSVRKLTVLELIFCLGCFAYYFVWAVVKPLNYAPDELMRYDVTRFLYEHNRLPVGDELLSIWGFSYAHLPTVLCNQIGYVFMKVASVFSADDNYLLLAARMVSVCCGVFAVYFTIKISKLLFRSPARWIMVVLVAFMPQYAFLTSYINNDIVAYFGITMILYGWTLGMKDGWNFSNATLLSLGISVCALAYYNSYAWILFSIFFFFATYFYQNPRDYKGAGKLTAFIVGAVFVLIGYSFLRHLVLYGDLLGFDTSHYYGELYAIDSLKPSNRYSMAEQGISLVAMLISPVYRWLLISWTSFIGNFGYMEYSCPQTVYMAVTVFIAVGGVGLLIHICHMLFIKRQKLEFKSTLFWCMTALSAAVTVALSIYNSYNTDFQPQGRYCYPALPAIAIFVAKGYEWILERLKKSEHRYAVASAASVAFVAVSLYVFLTVYLPS